MPHGFAGPRAAMRTVRAAPTMVAPPPVIRTVRGEAVPPAPAQAQEAPAPAAATYHATPDPTASWPGGVPPAAVPPRGAPRSADMRAAAARSSARADMGAIDPALLSTIIQSGTSLAKEGIDVARKQPKRRPHEPRRAPPPPPPPPSATYAMSAPGGMPTWGKVALGVAGVGAVAGLIYLFATRRRSEPRPEREREREREEERT